jgi:hypothetical protein
MSQADADIGRQVGKDASLKFGFKCLKYQISQEKRNAHIKV